MLSGLADSRSCSSWPVFFTLQTRKTDMIALRYILQDIDTTREQIERLQSTLKSLELARDLHKLVYGPSLVKSTPRKQKLLFDPDTVPMGMPHSDAVDLTMRGTPPPGFAYQFYSGSEERVDGGVGRSV